MKQHLPLALWTVMTVMIVTALVANADRDGPGLEKLTTPQTWVGKNGNSIRGVFILREGDFVRITNRQGKAYRIKIDHFDADTRKWFLGAWEAKLALDQKRAGQKREAGDNDSGRQTGTKPQARLKPGHVVDLNRYPSVDTSGYAIIPPEKATRLNLPNFDQADYGKKASDCVPNSYAMFAAWWHLSDWIPISGHGRHFSDKVEWIHQRLARATKTRNNSGTSNADTIAGLQKFYQNEVESNAAFTMERVTDYRPETLARHTKGANATVLMLTLYYGRKNEGGHAVALKLAAPDGTLEFNTWGCSLQGKLKVIPGEKVAARSAGPGQKIMLPRYEIELSEPSGLPKWFKDYKGRFVLDASQHDCLMVLTPYLPTKPEAKAVGQ